MMQSLFADLLGDGDAAAASGPQNTPPAQPSKRKPSSARTETPESAPLAPSSGFSEPIPPEINLAVLAQILGLSESRTRGLIREGKITRGKVFDTRKAIREYCDHLRDVASRSGGRPSLGGETAPLAAEKLRLTKAQADKEEARVARERGELVSAAEVEREWASILRDVRSTMMAVPSRVGATLPHLTPHDVAQIDREVKAALGSLSDGN
ncbi:hypothetical protein ACIPCF_10010 [Paracoccus marcusii]|uniref:hypothetical protein n=1 Tax=Paracoccus marcusii TaxID=59779 RepID=UPI0038BAC40E